VIPWFVPVRDGHFLRVPPGWRIRNPSPRRLLLVITIYFFDFPTGDILALDDEGAEFPDAEAAHIEALGSPR
jgi:hypothetical protein